jgi:hypothetical protein
MRAPVRLALLLSSLLAAAACSSDTQTQAPDGAVLKRDAGPDVTDAGVLDSGSDAGQGGEPPVASCAVEAPRACTEPKPGYDDVSPILKERCVLCHSGAAGGPWPLTSYGHVADWQNEIRDQVSRCSMPPADAGVPITSDERAKLLMWIRCGTPR